jgi:uncharacterized protein with FMN-binding domain
VSSKDRVTNNLAALGAAAVLTVYAAGYARTQPAAQRFEDEGLERRPPPPTPKVDVPLRTVAEPPVPREEKPAPVTVASAHATSKPTARAVAPADSTKTPEPAVSAPTPVAQPVAPPAALLPIAPASDTARPATAATVDTAAKAADVVAYKDGVYFAWGTSRHGDVQMGVEIKGGRISSAFISECYTQYDCSWIAHLPKQVVARQSADVDFVSGATHSANALYKAVVAALKQAK